MENYEKITNYKPQNYSTNNIIYSGIIVGDAKFSHEVLGELFYTIMVKSYRKNPETFDIIPVLVSERIIDIEQLNDGVFVKLSGQWRTRNVRVNEERTTLEQSLFTHTIEIVTDTENFVYDNILKVTGYLTRKPVLRITPRGKKIADCKIAVNRAFKKSDYIPTIIWGRGAQYISSRFDAGTEVVAEGRIQSREYFKTLEDGTVITGTVYEYSVRNLWVDDKLICGNTKTIKKEEETE